MAELTYVCAYFNWIEATETLTDPEKGRLYTALLQYGMTGEVPELRGNEKYVFHALKWTIDRDKKAYDDKCLRNRENGSKGDPRTVANAPERPRTPPNAPQEKEEEKQKEKEKEKEKKEYILPTGEVDAHTRETAPFNEIVNLYHSICKTFPKVMSLSEKRKSAIRARLNTYTVDQFKEMFKKAESSSFLKGANDRDWIATFDWLIADSNFAKVLDGNYDDKTVKTGADKPHKTRFVPNPTRDTTRDFETSMAIIEAELKGVKI